MVVTQFFFLKPFVRLFVHLQGGFIGYPAEGSLIELVLIKFSPPLCLLKTIPLPNHSIKILSGARRGSSTSLYLVIERGRYNLLFNPKYTCKREVPRMNISPVYLQALASGLITVRVY